MAVNKNNKTKSVPKTKQNKWTFKEPTTPLGFLIPFIATLVIIPLIIRYKCFENNLTSEYWHGASTTSTDIFLAWKSTFLTAFGVILFLMLIMALVMETKKFVFELEYAPLTVYLVFVLLSTFASEHIYFAIHGIENHFESLWVLLAYIVLAFYGSIFVDNTKAIKIVLYGWLIGTWCLMLIGVFQAFKLDVYTTEFIKKIILPAELQANNLKLNFELGQVYITLYNPNYVGYFAAVTIPVFLTVTIFVKEYWKKALFGVTVLGVFICVIGSGAKNGLLALAAAFLFMIVMFRRQIIKNIIPAVIALVVFVALFFGVNALRHNAMINSIKGSLQVLFNKTENTNTRLLDSITCTDNGVVIMYDGKPYTLTMSYDNIANIGVSVFNEEQKQIIINDPDDPSLLISSDDSFPVTIKPVKYEMSGTQVACVQVNIEGHEYTFSNQLSVLGYEGSDYYYLNASGKWVKIIEAETAIFTNKPRLFSNRGYIWARSIPLLKKHIFLGSGPDTFALEFPNNDYVNSAYVGYLNQIITKPHSLYLQIGVQTGVISMLAFIAFFLIYFIRSIMLYWKHPLDTLISKLGIGISAATLGYMVSGITNDSTITYAPVFWGIIGVGIALNRLVKNEYNSRPEVKAEKAE